MNVNATTFPELIASVASSKPDHIAFKFLDREITYDAFQNNYLRLATALVDWGYDDGARVGYLGKNSDRYFEILLAAMHVSSTVVPIGWRLAPAEIATILQDAEVSIIFVDSFGAKLLRRVREIADIGAHIIDIGCSDDEFEAYTDVLSRAAPLRESSRKTSAHLPFLQIYTSGTTGRPKGVLLNQANFFDLRRERDLHDDRRWDEWEPDDVALVAMPIAHIGGTGMGLLCMYNGVTGVVTPEFRPEQILGFIQTAKVNRVFLVPSAIKIMLEDPEVHHTDFSRLRTIVYGASPMPHSLLKQAIEVFRCGFVQTYGMTETMGTVVHLPEQDHKIDGSGKLEATGVPMSGVEIEIRGKDGGLMPAGETGEVYIRSGANMTGYWKRPQETANTITSDGWLRTGDAAYRDPDGYIYVVDRIKDMIITGGENVYPAEVENALSDHPALSNVAVIGTPHAKWGEAVTAIVETKPGEIIDEDGLTSWVRDRVAGFKVPKLIKFVDEMPRNATGKILKSELRRQFSGSEQPE